MAKRRKKKITTLDKSVEVTHMEPEENPNDEARSHHRRSTKIAMAVIAALFVVLLIIVVLLLMKY